jgi:hypothetical protein
MIACTEKITHSHDLVTAPRNKQLLPFTLVAWRQEANCKFTVPIWSTNWYSAIDEGSYWAECASTATREHIVCCKVVPGWQTHHDRDHDAPNAI